MGKSFGELVVEERKRVGMAQKELVEKLDVHRTYLSNLEHDRITPNRTTVDRVLAALDVNDPAHKLQFYLSLGMASEDDVVAAAESARLEERPEATPVYELAKLLLENRRPEGEINEEALAAIDEEVRDVLEVSIPALRDLFARSNVDKNTAKGLLRDLMSAAILAVQGAGLTNKSLS